MNEQTYRQRLYAQHIANGECPTCGQKLPIGAIYKNCDNCRQYFKHKRCRWKQNRDANGICTHCKNPREDGLSRCRPCIDKARSKDDARRRKLLGDGICFNCGKNPHLPSPNRICRLCYLKRMAGHCLGFHRRYKEILAIFDAQGGKCPYTGEILIIGDNASIDHIYPQARFPEKKHDIDNLEWVTLQVNLAKRDLTKDEFLALTRKITSHNG